MMHLSFLELEVQKWFVQISVELFETLKVLACQPGYVFQSDYLGGGRMLK